MRCRRHLLAPPISGCLPFEQARLIYKQAASPLSQVPAGSQDRSGQIYHYTIQIPAPHWLLLPAGPADSENLLPSPSFSTSCTLLRVERRPAQILDKLLPHIFRGRLKSRP